jgi:hypothetical protein
LNKIKVLISSSGRAKFSEFANFETPVHRYVHITKQENHQRYKKCKIKEFKNSIFINKENKKIKKKQKKTKLKDFIIKDSKSIL